MKDIAPEAEARVFGLMGAAPEPADAVPQRSPRRMKAHLLDSTTTKPGNEWMLTYLDTVTLLITLLVMILSYASFDKDKFDQFKHGMSLAKYGAGIMTGSLRDDVSANSGTSTDRPLDVTPASFQVGAAPDVAEPQPQLENDTLAVLQEQIGEHGLGDDIRVRDRQGIVEVEIKANVLFPLGRANLSESGIGILTRLSGLLKSHASAIVVEGHTDNLPTKTALFPSNWELSGSRASSVARHFIANGIGSHQLKIVGFADTRPLVPNTSPEQRQQNRRVNIVLELPAAATSSAASLALAKR